MKISVIIPTLNEEEYLERVIDSVRDLDEVIVCDRGSTDRSVEVAQAAGARVVHMPESDKEANRHPLSYARTQARNAWILYLDPDELVPSALIQYLREFVASPKEYAGLYIPRKNYVHQKFNRSSYPDYQLRFYRKEGSSWDSADSQEPHIAGNARKIPAARKDLALIHIAAKLRDSLHDLNLQSEAELERRANRRVSMMELVLSPMGRFMGSYFGQGKFIYGKMGLMRAMHDGIYRYLVLAKIIDREGKEQFWKMIDDDRTGNAGKPKEKA